MNKKLVYDFPTRFFHWLFSGLFITAFVIAKRVDSESSIYPYHMLIGLTLAFLVVLRFIWGLVGTRHAKFTDFALNPKALIQYFGGILKGDLRKWSGHNPASSWAAITMMVLALGSALTGYLMTSGTAKENLEDVHEVFANTFFIVALFHIAGIIVHTIRHREMLGLSMIDGKKADVPPAEEISSARLGTGILFVGLFLAFGIQLLNHYDSKTKTLSFFGTSLILGENENEGSEGVEADESDDPEEQEHEEVEI